MRYQISNDQAGSSKTHEFTRRARLCPSNLKAVSARYVDRLLRSALLLTQPLILINASLFLNRSSPSSWSISLPILKDVTDSFCSSSWSGAVLSRCGISNH